jgi:hypothetical protein
MKLLMTGSTRSGQKFVSRSLRKAGVKVGWENCYRMEGFVGWKKYVGDVSCMAVPWLHEIRPDEVQVIHLVRSPIDVMNSMVGKKWFGPQLGGHPGVWQAWLSRHCPEAFEPEDPLERAATWWLRWNERVEPYADDLLRVETWGKGRDNATHDSVRLHHTLDELPPALRDEVIAKAESYGYPPP